MSEAFSLGHGRAVALAEAWFREIQRCQAIGSLGTSWCSPKSFPSSPVGWGVSVSKGAASLEQPALFETPDMDGDW